MRFQFGAVRNLLYNLVRRDLTVRYKSTVLGFFWSFIKPLAMTGIFWVVFQWILGARLRPSDQAAGIPLALHMLAGMLAWNFFAGATSEAMSVILANANLIKKVRLPLAVFPAATVLSHMVHFILGMVVLVGLLILFGLAPTLAYLWLIPLVVLHAALTFAVALVLSAVNVFYRDVASIWEVVTTAWFYATPVIYPAYFVTRSIADRGWPTWFAKLYLVNPMTPVVLGYRQVLIYASAGGGLREIPWLVPGLMVAAGVTLVLLAVAWRIFRHFGRSFADEL